MREDVRGRRRRIEGVGTYMTGMTLAALDLASGDKVIDVPLRYGYWSPTSFARAFREVHGVTPSDAQRVNVEVYFGRHMSDEDYRSQIWLPIEKR